MRKRSGPFSISAERRLPAEAHRSPGNSVGPPSQNGHRLAEEIRAEFQARRRGGNVGCQVRNEGHRRRDEAVTLANVGGTCGNAGVKPAKPTTWLQTPVSRLQMPVSRLPGGCHARRRRHRGCKRRCRGCRASVSLTNNSVAFANSGVEIAKPMARLQTPVSNLQHPMASLQTPLIALQSPQCQAVAEIPRKPHTFDNSSATTGARFLEKGISVPPKVRPDRQHHLTSSA